MENLVKYQGIQEIFVEDIRVVGDDEEREIREEHLKKCHILEL